MMSFPHRRPPSVMVVIVSFAVVGTMSASVPFTRTVYGFTPSTNSMKSKFTICSAIALFLYFNTSFTDDFELCSLSVMLR